MTLVLPQTLFLILFAAFNVVTFYKSFTETKRKKNAFGLTRKLFFIGSFVWADAVIFTLFWFISCLICLLLQDWTLFLLITSLFWLVRALGETIYWFNQQFSTLNRNPIENLPMRSIFHNDSIWFVHQIFWQCVMVATLILSMYFSWVWLHHLPTFGAK